MAKKRKSNTRRGNRSRQSGRRHGSSQIVCTSGTYGAGVQCAVVTGTNLVTTTTNANNFQWTITSNGTQRNPH
jgi:hypothetical protein